MTRAVLPCIFSIWKHNEHTRLLEPLLKSHQSDGNVAHVLYLSNYRNLATKTVKQVAAIPAAAKTNVTVFYEQENPARLWSAACQSVVLLNITRQPKHLK